MTFRDGDLLFLLLLVPLAIGLLVFAFVRRARAVRRFGEELTVRSLVAGRSGALRATRGVLYVIAMLCAIVALAGPQYGSRTRILRKRGVDVVVALDFSKSMLARDVSPSRIDRAKAEITRLFSELEGDRVGIVAFAGETMEFPMTTDYSAAGLFLRDLGPLDMPVGGTAIGRALVTSKRMLDRANPPEPGVSEEERTRPSRVVILFTDGEDHEGNPIEAARELGGDGIRIYTVGIGSRTGEPIPAFAPDGTQTGYMRDEQGNPITTSLTEENEGVLRQIAEISHGRYFRARRGDVGVDQIRAELRRMKQEERRSRRVTVHEERYALALLPAFLLLVLEALLPDAWIGRRRRRPPAPVSPKKRGLARVSGAA